MKVIKIILAIIFCVGAEFGWNILSLNLIEKLGWKFEENFIIGPGLTGTVYEYFFISLIFLPIIEEVVFRLPLWFVARKKSVVVMSALLVTSFLFGFVHGGLVHTLHKGPMGMTTGLVYLYTARMTNSPYKAVFASIILHSLGNLLVMLYFGPF